jgi:diguanylate cyclase (GGDEF)-like protein/putative nucleotidyltransferase with HDIG domain
MKLDMSDYNAGARVYWCSIVIAGAVACGWAAYNLVALTSIEWMQFLALFCLIIISSAYPIRIPNTKDSVTASDTFVFLSAIFLGVPAAILLGATDSLVSSMRTTRRATSWLFAPAMMASIVFITGHVFYLMLETYSGVMANPVGAAPLGLAALLAPLMTMALLQYFLNGWSVATLHALKSHRSIWKFWRDGYLWTSWTFFAAAIAAVAVHQAILGFGFIPVALTLPVIGATYATYKIYFERVNQKTREAAEMSRVHLATVEALATAIDAKDQTTHCHVRRVQLYAARLGELFDLSNGEIEALRAGALLHDVGKLAVPDHILNKPGKVTPAEFEKIKLHTIVGAQMLESVNFPYPVVPIVRHHHERWDGKGYPDGLKGEEIPLTARIISVVDTFDSVREERPFRKGRTRDEAAALLRRGAGSVFDPRVVDTFLAHLPRFDEEIRAVGLDHRGLTLEACAPRTMIETQVLTGNLTLPIAVRPDASARPSYLDQIKNAHREGYGLYEIARTFGSSLDVQDIVTILVNKVGHIVPFDTCAVYLYDEMNGYSRAAHVAGFNADLLRDRIVSAGEGVVGFALANRLAVNHFDPMLDFADIQLPPHVQYRSVAALPLIRDERTFGVLAIYSLDAGRYTEESMRLLDTIARLASDALANAVYHAEARTHAQTDALTGLPNARALYHRFEEEAARARRTGRPFGVVMLDLDEFKAVNDTFGHKTGDIVLREVGRIIQTQLREYDFLARYAGDEFVAIVHDLNEAQTEDLRERIERAVTGYRLHIRADKHARVGISVGTANFAQHGETLDQLLVAADQAMYRAKSEHKRVRALNAESGVDIQTSNLASSAIN